MPIFSQIRFKIFSYLTIKGVLSFEKNIEVIGQVRSCREAVEFAKIRSPVVILMDIEMEERRDGIDAVAEIMDLYPQTKIVMLTVQEDEESILSSFEAGACDYVLKSASAKEIIDAVEAAYNNCSPIRPMIAGKIRKQLKHVKKLKDNMYDVISVITMLTPTERAILIDFLTTLSFGITDIKQIVASAVDKMKASSGKIIINANIPDTPLECYADKYHLSEVIINIIKNAIEAIGKDAGTIDINVYAEQGWNIISISDNGPGIPRKHLKKIFTPFFSTKSTSKNWGIGLTFCYKTIKAHNGMLLVDSKTKNGTKFNILLPMVLKQSSAGENNLKHSGT